MDNMNNMIVILLIKYYVWCNSQLLKTKKKILKIEYGMNDNKEIDGQKKPDRKDLSILGYGDLIQNYIKKCIHDC